MFKIIILGVVQGILACTNLTPLKNTIKKTLRQPFFISPFLPDDVIRAPDLWLAVAATCCTSEALPHFIWAFATT